MRLCIVAADLRRPLYRSGRATKFPEQNCNAVSRNAADSNSVRG
jgi:hypothetical protein